MRKPSIFDDPAHWRQRAEEARQMADRIDDPAAKKTMQDIADAYDRLVAILESKAKA